MLPALLCLIHITLVGFLVTMEGFSSGYLSHVNVDISRCIDVMNYFRCPAIMGPGKAPQWGFGGAFDEMCDGTLRKFTCRGVAVLPSLHISGTTCLTANTLERGMPRRLSQFRTADDAFCARMPSTQQQ